jgi:hypothetical protein
MYFDDKTCVICCEKFDTVEEHNKHYKKCSDENSIELSAEERWDIINNPDNYRD